MNSYELSRKFVDFGFENPSKIKPNHYALYFFAIEHCNRLGWKKEFGLPTTMAMEAIGIKSYNTYINTFTDLENFGFIEVLEKSKNQYSSNIIALSNFNKALDKALDKAFIKHTTRQVTKQSESIEQSIDSIIKQLTINKLTNKQINKLKGIINSFEDNEVPEKFNFRKELLSLGAEKDLANDWLKVRKTKKATNSESAFKLFKNQVLKSKRNINDVLLICIDKDWKSFNSNWATENDSNKNTPQKKERKLTAAEALKIELERKSGGPNLISYTL